MGLFSSIFKANVQVSSNIANDKEAFIAILFAAMSADGEIDDEEISALAYYTTNSAYMGGFDLLPFYRKLYALKSKIGMETVVGEALTKVKPEMKESLFANTVNFVLADGIVTKKEEALLEDLQKGLGIEKGQAEKIIEVLLIMNKS